MQRLINFVKKHDELSLWLLLLCTMFCETFFLGLGPKAHVATAAILTGIFSYWRFKKMWVIAPFVALTILGLLFAGCKKDSGSNSNKVYPITIAASKPANFRVFGCGAIVDATVEIKEAYTFVPIKWDRFCEDGPETVAVFQLDDDKPRVDEIIIQVAGPRQHKQMETLKIRPNKEFRFRVVLAPLADDTPLFQIYR